MQRSDLGELSLPKTVKMEFPNVDDVLNFKLAITPDEGEPSSLPRSFTTMPAPSRIKAQAPWIFFVILAVEGGEESGRAPAWWNVFKTACGLT
jgi:hypothetical protein